MYLQVFEQIAELAAVALIPPDQQAVCPHTACLSIFEVEPGLAARQPRQQCPHCRRLLCLQCKTAWHSGVTCDQNLEDPNTQMLLNLARQENLARCPGCSSVVERTRVSSLSYRLCACSFSLSSIACCSCAVNVDLSCILLLQLCFVFQDYCFVCFD